jgi:hypothetical protein
MASSSTLERWKSRFGKSERTKSEPLSRNAQAIDGAKSILIGRHHYVFVLDWRLYNRSSDLSRTMRTVQRLGYSHYLTAATDIAGFAYGIDRRIKQKPHAAAMHLAETSSRGGLEMFVFRITETLYSLTVLSESKPVPHFDQVGSLDEVMALIQEYKALQSGQAIRYVGNVEELLDIEKMALSDAFGLPDPEAALQGLPNYQFRIQLAAIMVPVVLIASAGGYWWFSQKQKTERQRLTQQQDPNLIYERQVDSALQQIGPDGNLALARWREVFGKLPVTRSGWRLEKVVCEKDSCTAHWRRESGSVNVVKSHPPAGMVSMLPSKPQSGDSPAEALIETTFSVEPPAGVELSRKRNELPTSDQAETVLTSQLQDMALLPDAHVKLKPPELFPSTGATLEQLMRPVIRGEWSITHELWSLGDLKLNLPAQAVQNLTIQLDEKTKNWVYTLTGHYYAKGKKY